MTTRRPRLDLPATEVALDVRATNSQTALLGKITRQAKDALRAASVALFKPRELPLVLRRAVRRGPASVDRLRARAPEIGSALGTDYALLVPIAPTGAARVVAFGFRRRPRVPAARARRVADEIGMALTRVDDARDARQRRATSRLIQKLGALPLTSETLIRVLTDLCVRAVPLFQASHISVWLHDRRAGILTPAAASDVSVAGKPVATTDRKAPAARGLRQPPEVSITGRRRVLTAPLRGSRRVLGTLVVEGIDLTRIPAALALDHAQELVAWLGPRVESISLLDDVIRARRELENTFNSMSDLVLVCNRQLQVQRSNQVFANRVGLGTAEIAGQPLSRLFGPKTVRWLSSLAGTRSGPRFRQQARQVTDVIGGGTFSITATPLLTPGGRSDGVVLVARDMTEQERLEAERAALRERLTQSEKLAAPSVSWLPGLPTSSTTPSRASWAIWSCCGPSRRCRAARCPTRFPDDLPRCGSRGEDRPQPLGLRRIAPADSDAPESAGCPRARGRPAIRDPGRARDSGRAALQRGAAVHPRGSPAAPAGVLEHPY